MTVRRLTDIDVETIAAMTRGGATTRQIAERIGCTPRTVTRWRHNLGLAQTIAPPLTDDEIETIHRLADDGCSIAEIARTIGRAFSTVRRIRPDAVWIPTQVAQHALTVRHSA